MSANDFIVVDNDTTQIYSSVGNYLFKGTLAEAQRALTGGGSYVDITAAKFTKLASKLIVVP